MNNLFDEYTAFVGYGDTSNPTQFSITYCYWVQRGL
jgi:hypothetical protein